MKQISVLDVVMIALSLVVGLALATIARYPDATSSGQRQVTFGLGLLVGFGLALYCMALESRNTQRSNHASDN